MRRILSDDIIVQAHKKYWNENKTIKELSIDYNCSPSVLERWFRKFELEIRDKSDRKIKYPINKNIFDNVDSEDKAYWLGFLYADGNVSKTNRVRLSLAEQDVKTVENFSYFIYNTNRVKIYKLPDNKKGQDLVYVDICNKYISNRLIELGCHPNKTFTLCFPEWLNVDLINHFIRGYFDGDGCLSYYHDGSLDKFEFSLLSTKEFLTSIQDILSSLDINSSLSKRHKNRDNNNFNLKVHGNSQIGKLMDWIYKGATIYLQRKHDKYTLLKSINESKNNGCKKEISTKKETE